MLRRHAALCLLAVLTLLPGPVRAQDAQRAVLVTGATSGIGRATAELLAERGFFVYAGARSASDIEELNAIPNMMAVRLDVTVPAEIDAAVETIEAEGRGLWGLINNAGVGVLDPLIEVAEEDMMFQLDVNVLGPYRVTKAFAPLLIESQGRVSTTGSLSGFVTWTFVGPYTMSKHAVEAFSEVLALEMAPFGVGVSVVEPGNYDSRIYESLVERREERGVTTEGSLYGNTLDGMLERATTQREAPRPTAVAEAFYHAMADAEPKSHYLVVPVEGEARVTIQAILRRLAEVNRDHEFSFSRDELIQMLDEALGAGGN
ncbi:MAG TPA: SDR family oxidoreductase [Longimicrobiales bacterium]|nr:SDR family oxidoreductase [Longimicrobiales bacterium]